MPVPGSNFSNQHFAATRLFVSRDGGANWKIASTHHPQIQQIAVEAQDDGQYWFAYRHLTSQGVSYPNQPLQPQYHVLVDTTPPELKITTSPPSSKSVVLSVDAHDMALLPGSLEILLLSSDPTARWQKIPVDPRSLVLEQGRLKATVTIPLNTPFDVMIRAAIWDKLGHKTVAESQVRRQTAPPSGLDVTTARPDGISSAYALDQPRQMSQVSAYTQISDFPQDSSSRQIPTAIARLDRSTEIN
ncbi:MAG: hypothetical protein KDA84_07965, partial [Planctomycetaceae bacterium]|nr:hypothetical protein [Planctomycetaceae bacterium]